MFNAHPKLLLLWPHLEFQEPPEEREKLAFRHFAPTIFFFFFFERHLQKVGKLGMKLELLSR